MHGEVAQQTFSRHFLLASGAVVQADHSVFGPGVQSPQANLGVSNPGLIAKDVDHRFARILFHVLHGTPSSRFDLRMVYVLQQEMTVLFEIQKISLESLDEAGRSSREKLR